MLNNKHKNGQRNEVDRLFRVGKKEAVFDATMQPIMMMVFMSMVFGLLAYGMHRIAIGAMTIGVLMSFLMYLFNLIGAMPTIATLFSEMAKVAGSTRRVQELLNEVPEDFESGEEVDLSNKTLCVSNVDFAYSDAPEEPILMNVSFEAKPNEIIAFAGPSGGGKSTTFSLLERFYEPTAGTIKFGTTEIQKIKLSNYRSQIGYVSQDSAIMAGTIRYNLTYGLADTYTDGLTLGSVRISLCTSICGRDAQWFRYRSGRTWYENFWRPTATTSNRSSVLKRSKGLDVG